jgi:hypothetical protein
LVDFEGVTIVRYFGSDSSVRLSRDIGILGRGCFYHCISLSSLTFESGSKLTRIDANALHGCTSIKSICLPASLQFIDGSAFADTWISEMSVEAGNCHLRVSGDFLVDFEGITVIRYFGRERKIRVNRDIEIVGSGCFSHCKWISSLTFESGSKPRRIEAKAFGGCSSLRSILIPRCTEELRKGWAVRSSLWKVIFESGLSLRRMIETDTIDLSEDLRLEIVDCDCPLDFVGYRCSRVSGHNDSIVLIKKSSLS